MTIKSGWKHKKNVSQFIPKNPEKYCGSYPCYVRSSWERMYCQFCDMTPSIVEWSSESIFIKYWDPVQQRTRRYYPDFYQLVLDKDGKYKEYIIEIKPLKETKPPRKTSGKSQKTLRHQQATWRTNKAKFETAEKYCNKMNYTFKIITEQDLFNK